MVTGREASPQDAQSFLSNVFQSTDQHLDSFQQLTYLFEVIVNQQGEWIHAIGKIHVQGCMGFTLAINQSSKNAGVLHVLVEA